MSPEAQRIAIAEACGWINQGRAKGVPALSGRWADPRNRTNMVLERDLPDYLNDLNAMAEAEKVLTHSVTAWADQRTTYAKNLREILSEGHGRTIFDFDMIHATAAQRAEAFLKTLGLWSHGGKET